jgi:hypothetical protein
MMASITTAQLDDVILRTVQSLSRKGVSLPNPLVCELNEVINSFLSERCALNIIEEQGPIKVPGEPFEARSVSVRCEWLSYGYTHVMATSFVEAAEKVKSMGTIPQEQNPIDGTFHVAVEADDNLFE